MYVQVLLCKNVSQFLVMASSFFPFIIISYLLFQPCFRAGSDLRQEAEETDSDLEVAAPSHFGK
jgi:hypothetical protein